MDEKALAAEANLSFEEGNYVQAYAQYSQLVSLYGSNPLYAFRLGAAGIYATTDRDKCIFFMRDGIRRGYTEPETHYYLARALHLSYNFKEALSEYEKFESSAEKKQLNKSDCRAQKLSAESGLNLMNSIKDVQVIEKTEAEKSSFYRYMNIDPNIGKIISTPKELLSKLDQKSKEDHVFFLPNNGKKIFFSSKGKDGTTGKDIYMTSRVNGTFSTPVKLKSTVNTEFDEDFAFMHPNGSTLYFASKGHGSMGGYDIFRCEWDASINDFGPAINMDFAINTPDDDLFFITDSLNTTAYFASSRLTSPDKLYVYRVFVNGIPMNITYLKGEFISRVDATQTEAKIQVFDDLTNRKIMDTQARESNGQYLLFIPAAGNYIYKIQPPGSPQIHEVLVKIPPSEGSRVFRQEIVYTKTDGREKVEVKNYWSDPLNDNVEDLQRQMLLSKSQLDVNATADQAAMASSVTNLTNATSNSSISNNNQRIEIDTVLTSQEKTIAALKREIALAEQTSKLLLQYVQQTLAETDDAYEEFQTVRFEKPESIADSMKLNSARKNMIETQNKSVAAIDAYEISKSREKELKEKLNEIQTVNSQIKESIAKKDTPMAAYLVKDYVAKNPSSEKGIETPIEVNWKSDSSKVKVEENKAKRDDTQLRINTKTKELEEIEIQANTTIAKLSTTKKKKEIERLGSELSVLEVEYNALEEEIETEKEKLRLTELELEESLSKLKLLQALENNKQPEVKAEYKNLNNSVNVESLKTEIAESKNRVSTALENSQFEKADSTNNASSNNDSSNNASSNNASSNNASSNNASSNNVSSNNASSNNASSNNTSSNNASSNNASSNNASSNNASSNNASSNNASSNNASSNNASSNNASSNNASSNNASSNNASSNNASSNNASSNNASSNNASSNNASSNNVSSNNASSNNASSRTFTPAEESVLNSPGQSNYRDENIFNELETAEVEISNRSELDSIYSQIELIDKKLQSTTLSPEIKTQLASQKKQLIFAKMQAEDKNSLLIAEHNSIMLIDLQTAWKKNTSNASSLATLNDKKSYETVQAYMKEASTLREAAKNETDLFERYAKNARAFALERNAKNELQFLVEKTTPVTNNASSNNASSNNASSNNASSNNASSNNASSNNASSNNTSSNNASSITSIPKIIQRTLYQRQNTSAYSDSNPIPIGQPLPEGSFYTIQVGAFRLPVANNTFNQFAPVYAERQTNGFIRYSTGFFSSYTEAIQARNEIRQMGYSDAFIVAYKNRTRVRYSELMTEAEKASNNNAASSNASGNPAPVVAVDVNYYSDPLAVPAKLIEKTTGIFFTVQVGVYAKPSRNTVLNTYSELHVEKLPNGQIRYTSGKFQTIADVVKQRDFCRANGIPDAFITAYKDGKRISVPEAKKELGIQ